MTIPEVNALGVYNVLLTPQLLAEAMDIKYGGVDLTDTEREQVEKYIAEEISSAVLVDLLIHNPDEKFDLIEFHQLESDQVPYDEVYLSEDGTSVLSDWLGDIPKGALLRVAFFLHYFEPGIALQTSYGVIDLPAEQKMPEYLQKLKPYNPVD